MSQNDAMTYLENQRLKSAFKKLNLPLDNVFHFVPYNLEIENRRLNDLLDFTQQYLKRDSKGRERMELSYQFFPPIVPAISPENDWMRFRKWINGEPTVQKIKDRLPDDYMIISPEDLLDDALEEELERIDHLLAETGYFFNLPKNIPQRVQYKIILENLENEDLMGEGWHNDCCDGYCPGCHQRPWCESGRNLCWSEDEEAGKMFFPEELNKYVSPSPMSLDLLHQAQSKHEKDIEAINIAQTEKVDNDDTLELPNLGEELFDISSN